LIFLSLIMFRVSPFEIVLQLLTSPLLARGLGLRLKCAVPACINVILDILITHHVSCFAL
jgi:hypothetical protein